MKRYFILLLLGVATLAAAQNGTVLSQSKIADTTANFMGVLGAGVNLGTGVAAIGDLNGNGITELVVGAYDVGNKGAVYTLFMNSVGGVDSFKTITENVGGFTGTLGTGNRFGYSVALIGDLDSDGVPDIAASSELDDAGGSDRGAVWILYLKADGTVKSHTKISSTTQGSLLATPSYGIGDLDRFGSEVAGIGDLDGDGVPDIAATAIFDDDGGNNHGAVWIIFLNANGSIKGFQKISDTQGGFTGTLQDGGFWGSGMASIGDLDGDGVQDLAVGQELANANGTYKGALWILFMNTNGSVKSYRELRNGLTGTGLPTIGDNSMFGSACAGIGDIDGDGIPDLAVGANGSDSWRGGVYILMMNTNGTVKASQKINYNTGGLIGPLDINDLFGNSVTSLGDINGDGKTDIAVGSAFDDDGGGDKGAVYILTLQGVPTNCVHAAFNASATATCAGDTVIFTNTSTATGTVSYVWKLDGTAISPATNLSYAFNSPGTYTVRLVVMDGTQNCIDSVQKTITVKATTSSAYTLSICQGQGKYIGGAWRTTNGTYTDTLTNAAGCDSLVMITLDVKSIAAVLRDTVSICAGQVYLGHTQAGIYSDTFQVAGQCEVDVLDLRVLPNSSGTASRTICQGDSVKLGNTWRFAAGVYADTLASANGCDSIVSVTLNVLPNRAFTRNISICQGDSYFAGGANQTVAGTYRDTLVAANGCDSVVTTNLTVKAVSNTNISQTVCFGGNYLGYTTTGTYRDTLVAANGCDSIRTLNLTVRPQNIATVTQSICQGQNFEGYTATGIYRDTLAGANGCDSIRILNLTVSATIVTTESQTICFGDSYQGHAQTGVYRDTTQSSGGCDSVHVLTLTILSQKLATVNQTICQGQNFEGYTATGTYRDTLADANGCDSIRTLNLTVRNVILSSETVSICQGDNYQGYTQSGVYSDTTLASGGCDSIYTLTLSVVDYPIAPPISATNNVLSVPDTFDIYQWYLDGNLLAGEEADTLQATANGVYTVVVGNTIGCEDTSAAFNLTSIGIDGVDIAWSIKCYPNPTDGLLYLQPIGVNEAIYTLYNSLGQSLLVGTLTGNTTIDLASYAEGIYYLKTQAQGSVSVTRIIIR